MTQPKIYFRCYGVPHPTLLRRYMCLTPLRAAAAHYCTALSLPRRHWRCSSALPIRPCLGELIFLEERRGGGGRRRHKTTNGLCLMVESAAFEQGQKNQRGGTQTVHASNLKSALPWKPGEEGLCYFSRAHQFEVGSLLSSLGLHPPPLTLPFSSYAPFHDCHSGGASEEEKHVDVRAAFSDSHGEENNFKVAGRQESESGPSALLPLRRSHLCGKCSEKPLMVIRSAVAAPE